MMRAVLPGRSAIPLQRNAHPDKGIVMQTTNATNGNTAAQAPINALCRKTSAVLMLIAAPGNTAHPTIHAQPNTAIAQMTMTALPEKYATKILISVNNQYAASSRLNLYFFLFLFFICRKYASALLESLSNVKAHPPWME
jgi:hypothetical protein